VHPIKSKQAKAGTDFEVRDEELSIKYFKEKTPSLNAKV
jgi:hypothetical protein